MVTDGTRHEITCPPGVGSALPQPEASERGEQLLAARRRRVEGGIALSDKELVAGLDTQRDAVLVGDGEAHDFVMTPFNSSQQRVVYDRRPVAQQPLPSAGSL